jgi:hypothetical protein
VGSDSERLASSNVRKRRCSTYCSVPNFRFAEARQEKLDFAVLIADLQTFYASRIDTLS